MRVDDGVSIRCLLLRLLLHSNVEKMGTITRTDFSRNATLPAKERSFPGRYNLQCQ